MFSISDSVLHDFAVGLGGHVPDDAGGGEADVWEGHVGGRTRYIFKCLNLKLAKKLIKLY